MSDSPSRHPSTFLLDTERTPLGETSAALFLTSGFVYDTAEQAEATFLGEVEHYQYSRFNNPTTDALQNKLARLEGADACICTESGMAAVSSALLSHLKAGDRVVASRALFGSCYWVIDTLLPRYGVEVVFVDGRDIKQWEQALSTPAAAVFLETPSNPRLDIIDLRVVSDLAHQAGAVVMVDNVFASPLFQRPLQMGADVVVYSCTKHIDGQGRVLGGAVLGSRQWVESTLQPFTRNTGQTMSAFNAWVLLKSLETLPLRVRAMADNAALMADSLAASRHVRQVFYPGRADHPDYALAKRQMSCGGTMVAFELEGGKKAAFAFMNALKQVGISNNLGDARTIITHPATTTHMKISPQEREHLGITEGLVRLSAGIENSEDLLQDLAQALCAIDK